jgi:hypothetical protein
MQVWKSSEENKAKLEEGGRERKRIIINTSEKNLLVLTENSVMYIINTSDVNCSKSYSCIESNKCTCNYIYIVYWPHLHVSVAFCDHPQGVEYNFQSKIKNLCIAKILQTLAYCKVYVVNVCRIFAIHKFFILLWKLYSTPWGWSQKATETCRCGQ